MNPQIALTIEQMHELQSLGLDCSDASMRWIIKPSHNNAAFLTINRPDTIFSADSIPVFAYTLEDILMKLPKYLYGEDSWELMVTKSEVSYRDNANDCLHSCWDYTFMRNAFEMLKWVLKNHPDKIKKLER